MPLYGDFNLRVFLRAVQDKANSLLVNLDHNLLVQISQPEKPLPLGSAAFLSCPVSINLGKTRIEATTLNPVVAEVCEEWVLSHAFSIAQKAIRAWKKKDDQKRSEIKALLSQMDEIVH